jgi:hypothetical protein
MKVYSEPRGAPESPLESRRRIPIALLDVGLSQVTAVKITCVAIQS